MQLILRPLSGCCLDLRGSFSLDVRGTPSLGFPLQGGQRLILQKGKHFPSSKAGLQKADGSISMFLDNIQFLTPICQGELDAYGKKQPLRAWLLWGSASPKLCWCDLKALISPLRSLCSLAAG